MLVKEVDGNRITVELVRVTPEIAKEWLGKNTCNFRKMLNRRVQQYENDMSKNAWHFTGAPITFLEDGTLLNGQHRLEAVVRSGRSVVFLVVRGVSYAAAPNEDKVRPRTLQQWCAHLGYKHANYLPKTVRLIIQHEKGLWNRVSVNPAQVSDREILELIRDNYEPLIQCISLGYKGRGPAGVGDLAAISFIATDGDINRSSVIKWFAESIGNGQGLEKDDAALVYRNAIMNNRFGKDVEPYIKRALLTLAWNKTARGENAQRLHLTTMPNGRKKIPDFVEPAPELLEV